jgi:tripeptide aminopeptidase
MIKRDRLKALLLDLIRIDSVSRRERLIALRLKQELESIGAEVRIDDAGEKVGGNVGNLIARLPGTAAAAAPFLLSAHMDTVVPGEGVQPVIEGEIIRSDGTTVLGGDDKSGLAIICEVVRSLVEHKIPRGDLEVVFTICEEVGLLGAKHLDTAQLKARRGLVLDSEDVGCLFTRAPAADRMEFRIHGLEAHAGVCPEQGISAIRVVSQAIAGMRLGRIDRETTANVGLIQGGLATNIVPPMVLVKAEARSHDEGKLRAQTEHMRRCFEEAAAAAQVKLNGVLHIARVEAQVQRDYPRMVVSDSAPIVRLVAEAANALGYQVKTMATGGGCDANIFNGSGIESANLGTGMQAIHTLKESLNVQELCKAAEIVFEAVRLNAARKASYSERIK